MQYTHLDERRRLRTRHPLHHRLQELRQDRQHRVARAAHQVDDQVPDEQAPGLLLRLQLPRDELERVVQARLACRIAPREQLRRVLAHEHRERRDRVLS